MSVVKFGQVTFVTVDNHGGNLFSWKVTISKDLNGSVRKNDDFFSGFKHLGWN